MKCVAIIQNQWIGSTFPKSSFFFLPRYQFAVKDVALLSKKTSQFKIPEIKKKNPETTFEEVP